MIEIKIPLTDILNDRLYNGFSIKTHLIERALQAEDVDPIMYNVIKPNIIASDGYILVQFFTENKNA